MNSGIYKITNIANGKIYIGSAVNFANRWYIHKYQLTRNIHKNQHLQNAWNNTWNNEDFEFIIIEFCSRENLLNREQFWINATKCYEREIGYNVCKISNSQKGLKHTPQSIAKMSASKRGIPQNPDAVEQRNIANRKFNLWPCPKGSYCNCRKCKDTENAQQRERARKKRGY